MAGFRVGVHIILPSPLDADIFDGVEWMWDATLDELVVLDRAGWSATAKGPLPLPFWDVLLFFRNQPDFPSLSSLINRIAPSYGTTSEQPFAAVDMQIDGYAAMQFLAKHRPTIYTGILRARRVFLDGRQFLAPHSEGLPSAGQPDRG